MAPKSPWREAWREAKSSRHGATPAPRSGSRRPSPRGGGGLSRCLEPCYAPYARGRVGPAHTSKGIIVFECSRLRVEDRRPGVLVVSGPAAPRYAVSYDMRV